MFPTHCTYVCSQLGGRNVHFVWDVSFKIPMYTSIILYGGHQTRMFLFCSVKFRLRTRPSFLFFRALLTEQHHWPRPAAYDVRGCTGHGQNYTGRSGRFPHQRRPALCRHGMHQQAAGDCLRSAEGQGAWRLAQQGRGGRGRGEGHPCIRAPKLNSQLNISHPLCIIPDAIHQYTPFYRCIVSS